MIDRHETASAHSDPRDAALAAALPIQAALFARQRPLPTGQKRIIASADAIMVEASSPALHVCQPIAQCSLPYSPMAPFVRPALGPVPLQLLREFERWAVQESHHEIAAVIEVHEGTYRLRRLEANSQSASHVSYDDSQVDDDTLVIDLHSHGVLSPAFSYTDDESDRSRRGPHIAMVVGECGRSNRFNARVCVSPYLISTSINELVTAGVLA